MAYSQFTLRDAQKALHLDITEGMGIFAHIDPVDISSGLAATLAENVPLAVSINTEKARSELIVCGECVVGNPQCGLSTSG